MKREAEVPDQEDGAGRWSLDHLFLDQEGIPTLVEVKRSTDTRIRREVVGQMRDYAANALAYWSVESIRAAFEQTCTEQRLVGEAVLAEFLGPQGNPDEFWQAVKTNLTAGRLRLLFVADQIPDELRRIIEFLNEQMDPAEVHGVEIRQFVSESLKTLVPRVIGQTAEAERRKGPTRSGGRQWDEASFFAELERKGGEPLVVTARNILEWVRPRVTRLWWGRGSTAATCVPVLERGGYNHQLFTLHTGWASNPPGIETAFQYQANKPPFDDEAKRRELLRRFNTIPGVSLPADAINRRPSISLTALSADAALRQLFSVMEWYLQEVEKLPPE